LPFDPDHQDGRKSRDKTRYLPVVNRPTGSDVVETSHRKPTGPSDVRHHPMVDAMLRSTAEAAALGRQRLDAATGFARQVADVRTPHDLMTAQLSYLQVATDQYGCALANVMAAWTPAWPMLAAWPVASTPKTAVLPNSRARDETVEDKTPIPTWGLIAFRDPTAPSSLPARNAA
jgi:hypothetical protein